MAQPAGRAKRDGRPSTVERCRLVGRFSPRIIVVGAGSAGCAVAGRLATESSATVLLIEAGGLDRGPMLRIPLAAPRLYGTSVDWADETLPEPGCANRRIAEPHGRVLGGTSAINGCLWVKGSDLDYDGWQLPGWGWQDVAPVFARIEQGPMRVSRSPYPEEVSRRFVEAARAAGVAANHEIKWARTRRGGDQSRHHPQRPTLDYCPRLPQ